MNRLRDLPQRQQIVYSILAVVAGVTLLLYVLGIGAVWLRPRLLAEKAPAATAPVIVIRSPTPTTTVTPTMTVTITSTPTATLTSTVRPQPNIPPTRTLAPTPTQLPSPIPLPTRTPTPADVTPEANPTAPTATRRP